MRGNEAVTARGKVVANTLFGVTIALALLPIVTAAAHAVQSDWVPVGDRALFAVRARDVLTSAHRPLVGAWTSASVVTKHNFNNPGPMQYDLLALPTRLFGSAGVGIAVGVAAVDALAVSIVAWMAFRRGGALVGSAAMATCAALVWTMGSEAVVDPLQPYSLILPFFAVLVLAWSVACGDVIALPVIVVMASFVLQTYVTYGYLVAIVGLFALIAGGIRLRATWRAAEADERARTRRRTAKWLLVSLLLFVACWAQPVFEQFTSSGRGNLGSIIDNLRNAPAGIGGDAGTRTAARVLAVPPLWFRPSFRNFPNTDMVASPSFGVAVVALGALFIILAAVAIYTSRRRDSTAARAAATAIVAVAAGLLTAWRMPESFFGVSSHVFRWLWPTAAFVTFSIIVAVARRISRTHPLRLVPVFTVATAVLAGCAVPASNQGASADPQSMAVVRDLDRQLAHAHLAGPVLFDFRVSKFADPYSSALLAELQAESVGFVTEDPGYLYQLGTERRFNGTNARAGFVIREGDDILNVPLGGRRIALHRGLTPDERAELTWYEVGVSNYIRRYGVQLNDRGRRMLREHPVLAPDMRFVVRYPAELVGLIDAHGLELHGPWPAYFARYASLRRQWDEQTVAVFLTPVQTVLAPALDPRPASRDVAQAAPR